MKERVIMGCVHVATVPPRDPNAIIDIQVYKIVPIQKELRLYLSNFFTNSHIYLDGSDIKIIKLAKNEIKSWKKKKSIETVTIIPNKGKRMYFLRSDHVTDFQIMKENLVKYARDHDINVFQSKY
jgi:hypothetical protein